MCGIVAYTGNEKPNRTILLLGGIYNDARGGDAIGWLDTNNMVKKSVNPSEFSKVFQNESINLEGDSNIVLMHSRKKSVGANLTKNAHPFIVKDNLVGVHNGTIRNISELVENYSKLYSDLKMKEKLISDMETDSEIFFNLLALTRDVKLFEDYKGDGTFIWKETKTEKLYIFKGQSSRNSSERPLYSLKTKNGIYFSSLREPFDVYNKIYNTDYEIENVETNKIIIYNKNGVKLKPIVINRKIEEYTPYYHGWGMQQSLPLKTDDNELTSFKNLPFISPTGNKVYINKLRYCRNGHILHGFYEKINDYEFNLYKRFTYNIVEELKNSKSLKKSYGKDIFAFYDGFLINTDFTTMLDFLEYCIEDKALENSHMLWNINFIRKIYKYHFFDEIIIDIDKEQKNGLFLDSSFVFSEKSTLSNNYSKKNNLIKYEFRFCSLKTRMYVNSNTNKIVSLKNSSTDNIITVNFDEINKEITDSIIECNYDEIIINIIQFVISKYFKNNNEYWNPLWSLFEAYVNYFICTNLIGSKEVMINNDLNNDLNTISKLLESGIHNETLLLKKATLKSLEYLRERSLRECNIDIFKMEIVNSSPNNVNIYSLRDYIDEHKVELMDDTIDLKIEEEEFKKQISMEFIEIAKKKLKDLNDFFKSYEREDLNEDAQKLYDNMEELNNKTEKILY